VKSVESNRWLIGAIVALVLAMPVMARAQVVALEYQGGWKVDAVSPPGRSGCDILMLPRDRHPPDASWLFVARERRVRSEDDVVDIYQRAGGAR